MTRQIDINPTQTRARAWQLLLATGLLALLAALVSALSAQPSRATGFSSTSPGVKLEGKQLITAGQIKQAEDVGATRYTLRSKPDTAGKTVGRRGTSLEAIAKLAHLQQGRFGYLTLTRPDGTTIYLSSNDVFKSEQEFKDGPALISVKAGRTHFFRPVRQNKPKDVNSVDDIATASGAPLVGASLGGNVLSVEIKASDDEPDAGASVDFTASSTGKLLSSEKVRFSWQFSDGSTAEGESVSHTFSEQGDYQVVATATGTRDSGGQTATPISIGKAPPPPEPADTGGVAPGFPTPTPYPYDSSPFPTYTDPGISPIPGTDPNPTPNPDPNPSPQTDPAATTPGLETISGTLVTNLSGAANAPTASDSNPAASASEPASASITEFNNKGSESSVTLPLTGLGVALLFMAGAGRELQRSHRRPV